MDYLTVFDSHLRNMEYADHQNYVLNIKALLKAVVYAVEEAHEYLYIDILLPSQIVQSHLPLFYFPALDS